MPIHRVMHRTPVSTVADRYPIDLLFLCVYFVKQTRVVVPNLRQHSNTVVPGTGHPRTLREWSHLPATNGIMELTLPS